MNVSAIITSHNYARYLPEAIDSVLGQRGADLELIVVDDGSTDDTPQVIERYRGRLRYVRQENQGVAVARNRGIEESRGRYVAFLDADDFWLPGKLERQLAALAARADCRACSTGHRPLGRPFGPASVRPPSRSASLLEALIVCGNVIGIPSTVLCERSLFAQVGGFDAELGDCADWDMWIRIAAVTGFVQLEEPLVAYRLHDRNMTRNVALRERDSTRVLTRTFAMEHLAPELRARRRRVLARNYMILAGSYFHAGGYRDFVRCAVRAMVLDVRQAGYPAAWPLRWIARAAVGGAAEEAR